MHSTRVLFALFTWLLPTSLFVAAAQPLSITTNGTGTSILIGNQTVLLAEIASKWSSNLTSIDIRGSFGSILDASGITLTYKDLDAMAAGHFVVRSVSMSRVVWVVNCTQLLTLQALSCSKNQWDQYDQGAGYMFVHAYQSSSVSLSSVNMTCPFASASVPPCTAASIYSYVQLATALAQLQIGPSLTIRIMTNVSLPMNGTQHWLDVARAASSQRNTSLVSSMGILVFCNVTLIGQAGSITELDLGLNLDLFLINDNQTGSISMTNLVLINLAVGKDSTWPSSLLVGALWAINFNRKPASQSLYTVVTLTDVIVIVPNDLYLYLATWSARQASPVPQESATAAWMQDFVFFSIEISRADSNNLYMKQRTGSGTLWKSSILSDLPRVSNHLQNATGITSLVDTDPYAPLSEFTPVFNASKLIAQLSNASTSVIVIMASIALPPLSVQVTRSLSIIGRKTNPVALDFGGAANSILLSSSTTLKLARLTLIGLGPGNSSKLPLTDSSSRLLTNLTSGLWAVSFSRLSLSIVTVLDCTMQVSEGEVLVLQYLTQQTLSSLAPLSFRLNSLLGNASLSPASLVTPSASSLLQSLFTSDRIFASDAQSGLILFDKYDCLGLIATKLSISSNPLPSAILVSNPSYQPVNNIIGYQLPSPPPPSQDALKTDGLSSSSIGAIVGSALGFAVLIGLSTVGVVWLLNKRREAEIEHEKETSSKASVPAYVNIVVDGQGRSRAVPSSGHQSITSMPPSHQTPSSPPTHESGEPDNAFIITRAGEMANQTAPVNIFQSSKGDGGQGPLTRCRSAPCLSKSCGPESEGDSKVSSKAAEGALAPIREDETLETLGLKNKSRVRSKSMSGSIQLSLVKTQPLALKKDGLAGGSMTSDPQHAMQRAVKQHLSALHENSPQTDPYLPQSSQPDLMMQVQLENVLGQGSFGIVYKGRWRAMTVAVKALLFHDASTAKRVRQRALTEAAINQLLTNDNIVNTYAYDLRTLTPDSNLPDSHLVAGTHWKLYIVQEFCDGGPLSDFIDRGRLLTTDSVNWPWILQFTIDILRGLVYIHQNQIIHGDLSSGNILLKSDAKCASSFVAKVSDFGLSRFLSAGQSHISNARQGTPFYIAPEIISRGFISKAADIFSIGVLMREMAVGRSPPWRQERDEHSPVVVRDPSRPPDPHENELHPLTFDYRIPPDVSCPRGYREVTQACLSSDVKKRPKAEDLLKLMSMINSALMSASRPQRDAAAAPTATVGRTGAEAAKSQGVQGGALTRAKNVGYF